MIVISGPSGVGKSSIVDGLENVMAFVFSVSATTRSARPGEQDGVDYFFIDDDDFRRRVAAGEFLEWAVYNGKHYGTLREQVLAHLDQGHDVLLDIEVQGARQVRRAYPEAIMIFIAPPALATLEDRLRGRGDTSEPDIARRIEIARSEIESAAGLFDHIVVNGDLTIAIAEVVGILCGSKETIPHDD